MASSTATHLAELTPKKKAIVTPRLQNLESRDLSSSSKLSD